MDEVERHKALITLTKLIDLVTDDDVKKALTIVGALLIQHENLIVDMQDDC